VYFEDEEEILIYKCFNLSLSSNGFGVSVDTLVLKEFCKKYRLDFISVLEIVKNMSNKWKD